MPGRYALLIATYQYTDDDLRRLISPSHDAEAFARVLGDSDIGGFETKILLNQPSNIVRQEIEIFFANRKRDDMLLLYFSGHGVKDDYGRLYLATSDTMRRHLRSTALSANFVDESMRDSYSQQQVLFLDCCYSGAFAEGMLFKADTSVGTKEYFQGKGRVILTASDSLQYAFQGDNLEGEGELSIFTQALVSGLETGQADLDQDGQITLDELYDYVHDHVTDETPKQTPGKWVFDVQGEIVIAKNPTPVVKPAQLPSDLLELLSYSNFTARKAGIQELIALLEGKHLGMARAAEDKLREIAENDVSLDLRKTANDILIAHGSIQRKDETSFQAGFPIQKHHSENVQPTSKISTSDSGQLPPIDDGIYTPFAKTATGITLLKTSPQSIASIKIIMKLPGFFCNWINGRDEVQLDGLKIPIENQVTGFLQGKSILILDDNIALGEHEISIKWGSGSGPSEATQKFVVKFEEQVIITLVNKQRLNDWYWIIQIKN